jgi:sugar lactone lactonase YvrE
VVDPDGNYIRKYDELGMDLFGTPLNPQEVMVDSADRLWVIGRDRFYVIDSDGNLARIFERRGAPYVRATQGAGSGMPTQDTPRGYTIVRTSDPFARGNDPERPTVLDAGEFSDIVLGQGPARSLFYVADNSSNQVVAYDWSGSERGSLDLSSIPVQQEYRIVTDSDGYFYVLDPPTGTLRVYTPVLEHSADIQLDSFPVGSGWSPTRNASSGVIPSARNRCWINESGQLVLFINETRELLVYDIKMGLRSQRVNDQ